MNRRRIITIVVSAFAAIMITAFIYLTELSSTISDNLMSTVDEISHHDVTSVESTINQYYTRLDSMAQRIEGANPQNDEELTRVLKEESKTSLSMRVVYLVADDGRVYSSEGDVSTSLSSSYDDFFSDDNTEDLIARYESGATGSESSGSTASSAASSTASTDAEESLIFGRRLSNYEIDGRTYVGILARCDVSVLRQMLVVDCFSGEGVTGVVNLFGNYVIGSSNLNNHSDTTNLFELLSTYTLADNVTVEQVRNNIVNDDTFVVNATNPQGQSMVMAFTPIADTDWAFVLTVPTTVFIGRFIPLMIMTFGMVFIFAVVVVVMIMLLYRFMMKSAAAQAEAVVRAEFLSNMSHEIRTPLNGIIGLNHLMEKNLDDKQAMAHYVGKLGIAAQYLLALVNDILDMTKLQSGHVSLSFKPFKLRELVDNVVEMQQIPLQEKDIRFQLDDEVPSEFNHLVGDELRISQIIMNILSNAAKFTPEGGFVRMRVQAEPVNAGLSALVTISVADTGCGMTPEFQRRIFDPFVQERSSNDKSQKGTGLGMAISHLLVEEMGGTLSVKSEVGRGSVFTMVLSLPVYDKNRRGTYHKENESSHYHLRGFTHLKAKSHAEEVVAASSQPLEQATEKPQVAGASQATEKPQTTEKAQAAEKTQTTEKAQAAEKTPTSPSSSAFQILVAEDNDLNADIVSSILEDAGYHVTVAEDGLKALETFEASEVGQYGVILMDIQMPVMDGYEATRRIRALNRDDAQNVSIIACTASTFVEDRNAAFASGMNDFLAKPLNVGAMLGKIEAARTSHDSSH